MELLSFLFLRDFLLIAMIESRQVLIIPMERSAVEIRNSPWVLENANLGNFLLRSKLRSRTVQIQHWFISRAVIILHGQGANYHEDDLEVQHGHKKARSRSSPRTTQAFEQGGSYAPGNKNDVGPTIDGATSR
jgi:hypothetical protein